MRSMPPTDGATSVMVRPARSSPVAWTVSFSAPFMTRAVGVVLPRSGSRGTAIAMAVPSAITRSATTVQITRRFMAVS